MRTRRLPTLLAATATGFALAACGSSRAQVPTPTVSGAAIPVPMASAASAAPLLNWPEFGLDPQRSAVSEASTGIAAGALGRLRRTHVSLPGTVDSAPVYLHGATVAGAVHDVAFVTTTYGRTIAIDAGDGHILWTFTPPGYGGWAGSAQITTASPLLDPGERYLYAASPDGRIHKLSIAAGAEQQGWPATITRNPRREKVTPSLNLDGPYVIAATGGYFGDAQPYQGHVVLIDRSDGRLAAVYNTLCANRRGLMTPSSCRSSDSAILSRGGAIVEPGGRRILISTGNGPWNGTTDFGDSVLELTVPGLHLRQAFTPRDQAHLNESDTDLGSGAPVLLGGDRGAVAGKDGILRVLALSRLDGHAPSGGDAGRLGGEVQQLATPGGGELFGSPAVWQHA
ncbi:MAG: outer membrane protein assembly factor BamB family protein, partial [Solirubrobacteraceae bacterium]